MNIQEYFDQIKELQSQVLAFIDSESDNINEEEDFFKFIDNFHFEEKKEEFKIFLHLLLTLSKNHHRNCFFFQKIDKILLHFSETIKQSFNNDNLSIFNFFKSSKRLLLSLFDSKIISLNKTFDKLLIEKNAKNGTRYLHYFYTEIKPILKPREISLNEKLLLQQDPDFFNAFELNRHTGENNSYICSLIRTDSVEEFISYVNRTNLSLLSKIKPSLFETNSFLVRKIESSLIEYSAFYGSIQIFNFLRLKGVPLTPSLWLYAVHGRNPTLIHILEENHVKPPNDSYIECMVESVKCHHNEIACYIRDNLVDEKELNSVENIILLSSFTHENYELFGRDTLLFYLCKLGNLDLVKLLLDMGQVDIGKFLISFVLNNVRSKITPLSVAAENDRLDIINFLLSQPGIKIVESTFKSCNSLTEVNITSPVTEIGDSAFEGCSRLKKVTLPSSVTKIGKSAFEGCFSLSQFSVPPSVLEIENFTFNKCKSLRQVEIPPSVLSIGKVAFGGCESLVQVSIPSSVTKVEWKAFQGCSSLKNVSIPGSVTAIRGLAFEKCQSLENLEIPASVLSCEIGAFSGCSSLKEVMISSSIPRIEASLFKGCTSLEKVTIPENVAVIEQEAFSGCSSLESVVIPQSVTEIGEEVFAGCSSLKSVRIPGQVKSIGDSIFEGCESIQSVELPDSIENIGKKSFVNCKSLLKISIPASVKSIGEDAFEGCSSLVQISIPSSLYIDRLGIGPKVKIIKI